MITNIYLNSNNQYSTIADSPKAKEVLIKLPKNWALELDGFGGRHLLDECGNRRDLLTEYSFGQPVPGTIDNWGNKERILLAA